MFSWFRKKKTALALGPAFTREPLSLLDEKAAVESAPAPKPLIRIDAAIIGGGPVGMFAVFQLGLMDIKAVIIDAHDQLGGQCIELYPDKPIYDIPAWPVINGVDLTKRLSEQIAPFGAMTILGEEVVAITPLSDGHYEILTDKASRIHTGVIIIATGGGKFVPKKPAIDNIALFENQGAGQGVHYRVSSRQDFANKDIVITGGGDSALDWALSLSELTKSLTLVHRRVEFRASPHSVASLKQKIQDGLIQFKVGQVLSLIGEKNLTGVVVEDATGATETIPCQAFLPFYGLTMKQGLLGEAIKSLDISTNDGLILVDTSAFESRARGIFAIGDICTYAGKLKLILSGFHEAALMAQKARLYLRPDEKYRFQYTTTSSSLQKKLVVK